VTAIRCATSSSAWPVLRDIAVAVRLVALSRSAPAS
jgi:hypothetical protein